MAAPATIDVNVVCSGFTHALALADQAIRCEQATNALVIGADFMSAVTDWSDRSTCVLVGDGAGAAVVTAADQPGISPVLWGSVPEQGRAVVIEGTPNRFSQQGQAVFRWTTTALPAKSPPWKCGTSPPAARSRVDFPLAEAPTSRTSSPSPTVRVTSSSAGQSAPG